MALREKYNNKIMFLFPLVYILSFLYALKLLFKKNIEGLLIFIVFGLPIYLTTQALMNKFGFPWSVKILQSFKEILVFISLFIVLTQLRKKPRLHIIDYLMFFFLLYPALFLVLPIGVSGFNEKFIAYKALAFFPLVYFAGRFCDIKAININYIFSYVGIVTLAATLILIPEVITYTHFQSKIGFAEFNSTFYHAEPSGHYDLSWTFESSLGRKRFASFFFDPNEFSSAIVICISLMLALATTRKKQFKPTNFQITVFIASLFCIIFALSRASFAGYFLLIYCYGWMYQKKMVTNAYHIGFILIIAYYTYLVEQSDLAELVIKTLAFKEDSSVGHLLQWIEGITAIYQHPFGLGLGTTGRATFGTEKNIGGENQLIITGVQTGIITIIAYILMYWMIIKTGLKHLRTANTKTKKVILSVVLIKIGLIVPLLTSYLDSFSYLTYFTSFLTGYMMNLIMEEKKSVNEISALNN